MKIYPDITRYYSYKDLEQYDIFRENDWGWINESSDSKFKLLAASVSHFKYKSDLTNEYYKLLQKKADNVLVLIADTHNN